MPVSKSPNPSLVAVASFSSVELVIGGISSESRSDATLLDRVGASILVVTSVMDSDEVNMSDWAVEPSEILDKSVVCTRMAVEVIMLD